MTYKTNITLTDFIFQQLHGKLNKITSNWNKITSNWNMKVS